MAIVDGLTTLESAKRSIGLTDSTEDALIEGMISAASSMIRGYLNRQLSRTTYTNEPYYVSGSQLLYLREYPIQKITTVTSAGQTLASPDDYSMSDADALAGRIYRPTGWTGNYYSRGTFPDAFAGAKDISVTYEAGYYLPDDALYVAGAADSLPLAISFACDRTVTMLYRRNVGQAEGVKQYSEGGISTTWFGPESYSAFSGGLDAVTAAMLNPFKRREVA